MTHVRDAENRAPRACRMCSVAVRHNQILSNGEPNLSKEVALDVIAKVDGILHGKLNDHTALKAHPSVCLQGRIHSKREGSARLNDKFIQNDSRSVGSRASEVGGLTREKMNAFGPPTAGGCRAMEIRSRGRTFALGARIREQAAPILPFHSAAAVLLIEVLWQNGTSIRISHQTGNRKRTCQRSILQMYRRREGKKKKRRGGLSDEIPCIQSSPDRDEFEDNTLKRRCTYQASSLWGAGSSNPEQTSRRLYETVLSFVTRKQGSAT